MSMNQEKKAEWVRRLRDPNRKQGERRLRTVNADGSISQCCLDVLNEMAVEDGVIPPPVRMGPSLGGVVKEGYVAGIDPIDQEPYYETSRLIEGVPEWAGLAPDDVVPEVKLGDEVEKVSLIGLNDERGWSFPRIADAIEADQEF